MDWVTEENVTITAYVELIVNVDPIVAFITPKSWSALYYWYGMSLGTPAYRLQLFHCALCVYTNTEKNDVSFYVHIH